MRSIEKMIDSRNNDQMIARISELEQKLYQLESEKTALQSSVDALHEQLVTSKENEENLRYSMQNSNITVDMLEN